MKKTAGIILAGLMLFSFAACGGSSFGENENPPMMISSGFGSL